MPNLIQNDPDQEGGGRAECSPGCSIMFSFDIDMIRNKIYFW